MEPNGQTGVSLRKALIFNASNNPTSEISNLTAAPPLTASVKRGNLCLSYNTIAGLFELLK